MGAFVTTYPHAERVLKTACIVFPEDVQLTGKRFYTDNAIWDTGAEITVISYKIAKELNLKPIGEGELGGIGGDTVSKVYRIHLGLPSSELVHDLMVMSDDLGDHDVLIGMDIISMCDFAITHPEQSTKFTFARPSTRDLDFTL